ncbi:tumor suppressor, Mitostatin-domain-containing protein [Obelidium mucronatum]|nr:tumor suppressor, Mitostatin-domain-containing protein [Obelidium mucronatum]
MAMLGESMTAMRSGRPGRNSDYLIVNRRREEEQRSKMRETTHYYATTSLQSAFEETTAITIKRNQIQRRVEEMKGQVLSDLEARRERLRALLQKDADTYSKNLLDSEETRETVLAQMKVRMEELKSKREAERKAIVETKLLQRWRNECDELRTIESKVLEEKVAVARADQISELHQKKLHDLEEKRFYDQLWEQDRQKKIAREEREKNQFREMNAITVAMLNNQLKLLREQQAEEERLKQEEALLMRQETQMRKLEDERNIRRKHEEQNLIRAELDKFNSLRLQTRANEIQQSLEHDIKIVSDVLALDLAEKQAQSRRRTELRKEMQLYREHLLEQRRLERERDREIARLEKVEADKLWGARAEKWQKEQKARDKLMVEVLSGRRDQLKYSLEQNRLRQDQTRIEREQILRQIEIANHVEALDKERKEALAQSYRDSLEAQMETVEERKKESHRLNKREELAVKASC